MRSLKLWSIAAACIAAHALPLASNAQQAPGNVPPPPQLEKLEEGEEPAVTIRQPDRSSKTTEKRAPGGKVTEVQVTSGGSTYYLRPNDQAGSALPGDTQGGLLRAPQWEVLVFDPVQTQQEREAQAELAASVPAPPPPPEK